MNANKANVLRIVEGIPSSLKLHDDNNKWLRDGMVLVYDPITAIWQDMFVYVFSNVIMWAVPKQNSVTSAQYTYDGAILLDHRCSVVESVPNEFFDDNKKRSGISRIAKRGGKAKSSPETFQVVSGDNTLTLRCNTVEEKINWMGSLLENIPSKSPPAPRATSPPRAISPGRQQSPSVVNRFSPPPSRSVDLLRATSDEQPRAHAAAQANNDVVQRRPSDHVNGSPLVHSKSDVGARRRSNSTAGLAGRPNQPRRHIQPRAGCRTQRLSMLLDEDTLVNDMHEPSSPGREQLRESGVIHEAIRLSDVKALKQHLKLHRKGETDNELTNLNSEGMTVLAAAIRSQNNKLIGLLLESGTMKPSELNQQDDQGYTALHWAVREGSDTALLKLLSCKKIKAHVKNLDGNTPLHYFCERTKSRNAPKFGQLLMERGAQVNATNDNGETALHKTMMNPSTDKIRQALVGFLLANHADPNIATKKGDTPLHYAVFMNHVALVLPLLKGGAEMDRPSGDGSPALEIARREQKPQIVNTLNEYRLKYSAGMRTLKHKLASNGLEFVLSSPKLNKELFTFQESRLCGECVTFWNACQQYAHTTDIEQRRKLAKKIYKTHCDSSSSSELEVNLSGQCRTALAARMKQEDAPINLFSAAQDEIVELMRANLQSDGLKVARPLDAAISPRVKHRITTRARSHSLSEKEKDEKSPLLARLKGASKRVHPSSRTYSTDKSVSPRSTSDVSSTLPAEGEWPLGFALPLQWLLKSSLTTEGLFRKAGANDMIEKLALEIQRGELLELPVSLDAHVVCGALQRYIRNLSEPLVPESLYTELVDARAAPTSTLRSIVCRLQPLPYDMLAHLMLLLSRVAQQSQVNLMPATNLAAVLTPSLLRHSDPMTMMKTMKEAIVSVARLITERDEIFLPEDNKNTSRGEIATDTSNAAEANAAKPKARSTSPQTSPRQRKAVGPIRARSGSPDRALVSSPPRPLATTTTTTAAAATTTNNVLQASSTLTALSSDDVSGMSRLLGENKADWKTCDEHGDLPLNVAIKRNHAPMLELLLLPGTLSADVLNAADAHGYTALHWAARGHCAPNFLSKLLNTPGINVDTPNLDGNTPLHYFVERCASSQAVALFTLFTMAGANVSAANNLGETPLHKAVLNQNNAELLVAELLRLRAPINAVTKQLETPLHYAVHMQAEKLFPLLLSNGADPSRRSATADTPMSKAKSIDANLAASLQRAIDSTPTTNAAPTSTSSVQSINHMTTPMTTPASDERIDGDTYATASAILRELVASPGTPTPDTAPTLLGFDDEEEVGGALLGFDDEEEVGGALLGFDDAPGDSGGLLGFDDDDGDDGGGLLGFGDDDNQRVIETNPDAKRIYDALLDPIRRKQLVAHLARNHSPGLVLFLSAVLQYERIEYADARIVDAQDIYEQHLKSGSAHYVELDESMTFAVYQDIENGDTDLFDACFDAALLKIVDLLKKDNVEV